MEYVITGMNNGKFTVTSDDEYLASVLGDLYQNNTAFPDIIDLYEFKKNAKVEEKYTEDGVEKTRKVTVKKDALRVYFADGSWTDVVRSDSDKDDKVTAILYAIAKRLFGTPTEGGYVVGDGFMCYLKKLVKRIRTDDTDAEAKAKRIRDKEEADKKAHEDAVRRHEKNPSIGVRLNKLETSVSKLCETLNNYFTKASE